MSEQAIVKNVTPEPMNSAQVGREFKARIAHGAPLKPAGAARSDPTGLLSAGYVPKHKVRLFTTTFFFSNRRCDDHLGFFVAYVVPNGDIASSPIYPRIFYKDISLLWRCATHYARSEFENWIGKGDLKRVPEDGVDMLVSAEETTNLPLEIQPALDMLSGLTKRIKRDEEAVELILRKAPDHRLEPYQDFSAPRRKAMADPANRINRGKPVAYFSRKNDPTSLRFVHGFEPDFEHGVVESNHTPSRLYKGRVTKYRILSNNRLIQYQFAKAPKHVWINPPQALTSELSTYGVRTIDVPVDDDLCVPGYEYHYIDDRMNPPELHSQIPPGFAGEPSDQDPSRADASSWIEGLPVVQEFREHLKQKKGPRTRNQHS